MCLTFVKGVADTNSEDYFFVLVKDGNEISEWLRSQEELPYEIIPNNNLKRLKFEIFQLGELVREKEIDILYTFFGTLFWKPPVKLVMGCAYSNLFYPEIDFWRVGLVKRQVKKFIDWLRLNSYKNADLVVFENEGLAEKAKSKYGFKAVTVKLPSIAINNVSVSKEGTAQLATMRDNCFNLILLSGWHVNKNIDRLLAVARNLKTSGKNDVVFNLSLSLHDPEVNFFFQAISEEGLNKYFNFLGRVSPTDVQFLIRKGNAVLLISTLESFSNNIIEAWAYSRPLIITDAGWSRGACQDAALYVDIGSPQSIAQGIINISENERLSKGLVSLGKERLKVFPSPREKVDQHLKMLQDVYLL